MAIRRRSLHFDFETWSELNLKLVGTSNYARDPSTEVLMCAWSWDRLDEVKQWIPAEGEELPAELEDAWHDERVMKFAWNSSFERNICKNVLKIDIPYRQWRDPMVLAYTLSFPGALEKAGPIVNLPHDKTKDSRGKVLIKRFCNPRHPSRFKPWRRCTFETDPAEWIEFLQYNRQDVVSEKAFWWRCIPYDLPPEEWEMWAIDQEINETGIPINMAMVDNALHIYRYALEHRFMRMQEISGLKNPSSVSQLLPWMQDQGYPFDDLKKGHVKRAYDALEEGENDDLREMLDLRAEVSKTSVKKYKAMQAVVDSDGLFRHAFQFAGAGRTWRFSGRKVQYHNAPKALPYLEKSQEVVAQHLEHLDPESFELIYKRPMDALAAGVRPAIQAPPGYVFAKADANAIENRGLGYVAQDAKILEVFEKNLDPYVHFSTYMLGGTYDERWHEYKVLENKEPRTLSKPAVLGCGYGLGPGEQYEDRNTGEIEATGLLGYAWRMDVRQFTPELSELGVTTWRDTFADAVEFWGRINTAAMRCVRTGQKVECWPVWFDRKGPFLRMILPSGRALHYCRPRLEMRDTPWGEKRLSLTYENLTEQNWWSRTHTFGGKLTENLVQALCRDLLCYAIKLARKEGLRVFLHVHDEIVVRLLERQANWGLATLLDCFKVAPPWAPTMPLGAAGSLKHFYVKD